VTETIIFFITLTFFILDEGDGEIFLVDFDKKVNDELGTKSEIEEKSENRYMDAQIKILLKSDIFA